MNNNNMTTDIDLNKGPSSQQGVMEDLDLSDTFHDEEYDLEGDHVKVTLRTNSNDSSDDSASEDGIDYEAFAKAQLATIHNSGPRRRALVWTASTLVLVTMAIIVIVIAVPGKNKTSSNIDSSSAAMPVLGGGTWTLGMDSNNDNADSEPTATKPTASDANTSPTKSPTHHSNQLTDAPDNTPDVDVSTITLGCLTDRFDNENMNKNNRLYPGQYICSRDQQQRYRFGLTKSADVVLEDVQDKSTTKIFENPHRRGNRENATSYSSDDFNYYMTLQVDGTLVVHRVHVNNNGKKKTLDLWTASPSDGQYASSNIGLTTQCIADHDCPYFHIHVGGVMVLNWVEAGWQSKNFLKVYNF